MSWSTESLSLGDDLDFMSELDFDELFDMNDGDSTDVSVEGKRSARSYPKQHADAT